MFAALCPRVPAAGLGPAGWGSLRGKLIRSRLISGWGKRDANPNPATIMTALHTTETSATQGTKVHLKVQFKANI